MLVISRKSQEFVQIGEDIVVKIIKTARGSVKIGIDAPGGTRVLRGELAPEALLELAESSRPRRRGAYGEACDAERLQAVEAV